VVPKTRYARSGDVNIAYQVVGDGPLDLVLSVGWVTHLDLGWDIPPLARFYERLAAFSRLILFDKRGTGLSDPVTVGSLPTLEERMDDIRAVMDAAGSEKAALFGTIGGAAMCGLFAAMQPSRVQALVLYGAFSKMRDDFGMLRGFADSWEDALDRIEQEWGDVAGLSLWAPSLVGDERLLEAWAKLSRASVSPKSARALMQMGYQVDWAEFVPAVRVPTLVLHRSGDLAVPASAGRELAQRLPDAAYVELPGSDHLFWLGDQDALIAEVQSFLTGAKPIAEPDRVLATILFTDIVGSTQVAARLGDRRWRELRDDHDSAVREELARYRGLEVETAGDSFLATFDGPARAIRCAREIVKAVAGHDLSLRAGLHTGECELVSGGIRGLAVHIAARVAASAEANQVLVSSTVKDLVVGSDLAFDDRGTHTLKGVPGEWHLFAVED
jgi:class 3 adenylate cyclase